jgi:hypothetical protein
MADESYERQHLALQAAGFINSTGATQTTFGCSMTRSATGVYAMVLGDNDGVDQFESFGSVTVKSANPFAASMQDTSNTVKTITTFNPSGLAADVDIEVILRKSVTR